MLTGDYAQVPVAGQAVFSPHPAAHSPDSRQPSSMLWKYHQQVISSRHESASRRVLIQAARGCILPGAACSRAGRGGVEVGDARPHGFLLTPASAGSLIINCISSSNCCLCRWSWTRHHKQLAEPSAGVWSVPA